jgi:hypothetical protein
VIEDMVGSWMENPEDGLQNVPFRRPYYDTPISEWKITPVTLPRWVLPDRRKRYCNGSRLSSHSSMGDSKAKRESADSLSHIEPGPRKTQEV